MKLERWEISLRLVEKMMIYGDTQQKLKTLASGKRLHNYITIWKLTIFYG